MAWFSAIRGSYFIRPYIYKNESGKTVGDIAIWDPYSMSYGKGANGLSWAVHIRKLTAGQIKDEYPNINVSMGNQFKEYDVYDFWDTKNNGVIINGEWAKKLEPHGLEETPVYQIQVGAMPDVWHETYKYSAVHRGDSVFAAVRHLFPMQSKVLSDLLTIVRRGVKTPIAYHSAGGTKTLDQDIFQVEQAAVISLDSTANEKIEPALELTMPADTGPLLSFISGQIQRALFPHTSYGELDFRLSGYAISELQDAVITVISPFVKAGVTSQQFR
jgi:hypothetical protein